LSRTTVIERSAAGPNRSPALVLGLILLVVILPL
jgi:hypothetical protein